ncbi:MAG: hypothetical protein HY334_00625 [Armatimonadetes bacterium]|nr:hypothetical protein [Armatimonadota bacterium]
MLSGRNLRRLLDLRRRITTEAVALRSGQRRRLLAAMETARRQRLPGPRDPLRDLTTGEVLRQIKWLTGTLSLEEAEAAVGALERLKRVQPRHAARR